MKQGTALPADSCNLRPLYHRAPGPSTTGCCSTSPGPAPGIPGCSTCCRGVEENRPPGTTAKVEAVPPASGDANHPFSYGIVHPRDLPPRIDRAWCSSKPYCPHRRRGRRRHCGTPDPRRVISTSSLGSASLRDRRPGAARSSSSTQKLLALLTEDTNDLHCLPIEARLGTHNYKPCHVANDGPAPLLIGSGRRSLRTARFCTPLAILSTGSGPACYGPLHRHADILRLLTAELPSA